MKEQLEKARENNEKYKEARPPGGENKKEENVVVLARTGASGIALPVADREHEAQRGKRRRKKEKVRQHPDGINTYKLLQQANFIILNC